jgi:hypothetical protein
MVDAGAKMEKASSLELRPTSVLTLLVFADYLPFSLTEWEQQVLRLRSADASLAQDDNI